MYIPAKNLVKRMQPEKMEDIAIDQLDASLPPHVSNVQRHYDFKSLHNSLMEVLNVFAHNL